MSCPQNKSQKSISKHYAGEFGSPSKWLAIAKKCGALGAVSVRVFEREIENF